MNNYDTQDTVILVTNKDSSMPRVHICWNYNPYATKFDERGLGIGFYEGRYCIVTERTYY